MLREPASCPHSRTYSDYQLHQRADKAQLYQPGKLWWSDEIKRWMCTDAETMRRILLDPAFHVMSYSQEKIAQRLGIPLDHVTRMVGYFPLALDGEAHKHLRKRHAAAIAQATDAALQAFSQTLADRLQHCLDAQQPVDLAQQALRPAVCAFIAALAGIDAPHLAHGDSLSQVLDETLSIPTRRRMDQTIAELAANLPGGMADEEKYFRIAMVALGTDSLLGTLTESLHQLLTRHAGMRLSAMPWPEAPPATGVPVIERMATERRDFLGARIAPDQRVRLYLDAAGYGAGAPPAFQPLYFGAGRHVCLGMAVAKQVWKILTTQLARVERTCDMLRAAYREHDNVFNLYKTLEVSIHE